MNLKSWALVSAVSCALVPCICAAGSLDVTGGPGLDVGALCPTSTPFCAASGGSGDLSLAGTSNPLSGSFSYNPSQNEISFSLTLTQAVTFGSGATTETFEAGSVFSATDLTVGAPNGAGGVVQGSGTGAAQLFVSTSTVPAVQTITDNAVTISVVSCTTIGAGQCGVDIGGTAGGLAVGSVAGQAYDAALTFNTNVSAVPLPASGWLLLGGLGGLVGARRRRVTGA
jgi:hypothetical protein